MLLLAVLTMSGLTGFQVTWSVEPVSVDDPGRISLEITMEEGDLLFVRDSGEETASYEVIASLDDGSFDRTGGAVNRSALPMTENLSLATGEAGSHTVDLVFGDLESGRRRTWQEVIEVPMRDPERWSSGTIQVPSAVPIRSGEDVTVLWEVYPPSNAGDPGTMDAAYLLQGPGGQAIGEGWMNPPVSVDDGLVFSQSLQLTGLAAGSYELTVVALSDEQVIASSHRTIRVLQDWGVWGENSDVTISLVRPIASGSEIEDIENASGPGERLAIMSEFWRRRDDSPLTSENEFLEEYLRRLDYIEESFSVHNTMGINTDQGMVYALLGHPDIVEDRPIETSTVPYQVWTYFTPAVTVVFIDRNGYGLYELETSWEEVTRAWQHTRTWSM
jgi:GWxTD domain-containing protein